MSRTAIFRRLADYNRWMNENLYGVCAGIPDADRRRDLGAFFRSIHGTLNHLLLVDRLWLARFEGADYRFASLADELYSEFDALRRAREEEDERICRWIDALDEAALDGVLSYVSVVDQQPRRFHLVDAVQHLFHHQTHHRGQLTTLIGQLGHDFGCTDLVFMPGVALAPEA